MPDFLSDPSPVLYALLGVLALVTGARFAVYQKRKQAIPFVLFLLLFVGLFLIDRFFESPREEVSRKITEMAAATRSSAKNDFLRYVSDSFAHKAMDKKALGGLAERARTFDVKGIEAWDIGKGSFRLVNETTIEQGFHVQPVGQPGFQKYCVGTFRKEADGQFRLTGFKLYNPIQKTNGPEEDVPGF